MKKLVSALFGIAVIFTAIVTYGADREYNYWDFETESWELTKEGQELWEEALKARRENPAENKDRPEDFPYKCVERLTFKADAKGKYLAGELADVVGSGYTVTGSISQYQTGPSDGGCWYLSLKGKGGTRVFFLGVPNGWEGFNYTTTGNVMEFPTYQYINGDGHEVKNWDYYKTDSDFSYYIYVSGKPRDGKVAELNIWQPLRRRFDEEERVYLPLPDGDTDVLDCYDIKYEYTGASETFENGRNLYTLLGVSDDVNEYMAEQKKKEEFRDKYAYDEGPLNNHKKPLRYKSWNGKDDGGYHQWDFNLVFAGRADISDMNTGAYQYLKGIGDGAYVSLVGLETTRDGLPYDSPYPMVRVKGNKGEAWFDISTMSVRSDNGEADSNPRAVYVTLYKLKGLTDFVKYEDLTAADEEITMVLYFRDDKMTEPDRIVFDFGPLNIPGRAAWTVERDDFDFTGDIACLTEECIVEEDHFGHILDMLGIEL